MRLDDFADRLGDRLEAIRQSLEGADDVAVVDARDPGGAVDALLVATRKGLLLAYPWLDASDDASMPMPPGWVAWGDVRASTVQTIAWSGPVPGVPVHASVAAGSVATSTAAAGTPVARHCCTILLRGVELTAQGDGDTGRRAVDAFHDEVVRRGTPWHYPS
jgi:hypothetical protein